MVLVGAGANRKVPWNISDLIPCCADCITQGYQSLTNDTVDFLATLNQTLTCFEKNQQVDNNFDLMCLVCL